MMRLSPASLVAFLVCGALLGAVAAAGTRAATAQAATAAEARAATATGVPAWRSSTLSVSPAAGDLALLEIGFRPSGRRERISKATLNVAVNGPFGDDYLVVATPSFRPSSSPRALVLIVNRPSPLMDPASVRLRLRTARALGAPFVRRLLDPLTHPTAGLTPALCELALHGAATLAPAALRTSHTRGAPLAGFASAAAVAEAYDLACGLPYEAPFVQAIRPGAGTCRPLGATCCPPNAMCVAPPGPPTPAPPTPVGPSPPGPVPPGCAPCDPAPGYACPLATSSVCVAPAAEVARRVAAPSH